MFTEEPNLFLKYDGKEIHLNIEEERYSMKKFLRRAFVFFFVLMSLSITMLVIAEAKSDKNKVVAPKAITLPSEDENMLNSLLSAIGGFGGGGILLLFLIRRLVNSYDANFEKLQKKTESNERIQREQNEKLLAMVEDVHSISNDLQMEFMKIQVNAVDKDTLTEALTRVTMLEMNVSQVQGDVKDIVSQLRVG